MGAAFYAPRRPKTTSNSISALPTDTPSNGMLTMPSAPQDSTPEIETFIARWEKAEASERANR